MKAGLQLIQDEVAMEESHEDLEQTQFESEKATVIGAGPIGRRVASQLETTGMDVCLVDLSPINLHPFALEGFRTVAGDASDRTILTLAEVQDSCMTVVCVPDDETALRVVRSVRKINRKGKLIVRCRYQSNSLALLGCGVDCVVTEETESSLALLRAIGNIVSRS
jgi:CPA2 family monovalent cation:H+ antiporter-2